MTIEIKTYKNIHYESVIATELNLHLQNNPNFPEIHDPWQVPIDPLLPWPAGPLHMSGCDHYHVRFGGFIDSECD